jgi:hypothetical protein
METHCLFIGEGEGNSVDVGARREFQDLLPDAFDCRAASRQGAPKESLHHGKRWQVRQMNGFRGS